MDKLFALGFIPSADALLIPPTNTSWDFSYADNRNATNILYAFIFHRNEDDPALWRVAYIGHTRKSFGNRMTGYQQGHGTAVNNRIHTAVLQHLTGGGNVRVYVLPNHFGMKIFDLAVDTAAGLEYSLISFYATYNQQQGHPRLLNIAGNRAPLAQAPTIDLTAAEVADQREEEMEYIPPAAAIGIPLAQFDYSLGTTYWNNPSINVPVAHQAHFGIDGTQVQMDLDQGNGAVQTLNCLVSRRANINGTPRLWFAENDGETFQAWKHTHFQPGAVVVVSIVGPNHINLTLP
jgi:hypothetical protein